MKGAISIRPDDFVAGGLLNDVNVQVMDARWKIYDFNGKAEERTCVMLRLRPIGPDGALGEEQDQYWSAAKPSDLLPDPADDGYTPVMPEGGGKTALNNQTNVFYLTDSLVKHGFPANKLVDGDLRVLLGLRMHVMQKLTDRKFEGQAEHQPAAAGGKKRENTVLVCTHIMNLSATGDIIQSTATVKAGREAQTVTAADVGKLPTQAATTAPVNGAVAEQVLALIVSTLTEAQQKDPAGLPAIMCSMRVNKSIAAIPGLEPATKKAMTTLSAKLVKDEEQLAAVGIMLDATDPAKPILQLQ